MGVSDKTGLHIKPRTGQRPLLPAFTDKKRGSAGGRRCPVKGLAAPMGDEKCLKA